MVKHLDFYSFFFPSPCENSNSVYHVKYKPQARTHSTFVVLFLITIIQPVDLQLQSLAYLILSKYNCFTYLYKICLFNTVLFFIFLQFLLSSVPSTALVFHFRWTLSYLLTLTYLISFLFKKCCVKCSW